MFTEDTLTQAAPALRKNNLQKRTKSIEKIEMEKKPHIHMGYGECSVSGCNCRAYMGSADTCENCGHNKELHRY
jgi:translation initiation factor 2 gamma subunit (eIF-2gamma)